MIGPERDNSCADRTTDEETMSWLMGRVLNKGYRLGCGQESPSPAVAPKASRGDVPGVRNDLSTLRPRLGIDEVSVAIQGYARSAEPTPLLTMRMPRRGGLDGRAGSIVNEGLIRRRKPAQDRGWTVRAARGPSQSRRGSPGDRSDPIVPAAVRRNHRKNGTAVGERSLRGRQRADPVEGDKVLTDRGVRRARHLANSGGVTVS